MGYYDRDYYRPGGFGFSFFPPVIKNLLIINAVVFILQTLFENITFGGVPGWYYVNRYFALNPLVGYDQAMQPYNFQIWQLITYQFMHGGFSHILFNMFMLWMFGMEVENIWGSKKFLVFYILCGVGAGLFQSLFPLLLGLDAAPTVGASGSVFGVMIAFAMFFPDRYIFLYFLLPIKAKYLVAFLVVIEFLSVGNMSFVAHLAHIGGAVTGFFFVLFDKQHNFNFDRFFKGNRSKGNINYNFRRPSSSHAYNNVEDADFVDINKTHNINDEEATQEEIDRILDKISQSGYNNLTDREKRILFNASKKQ